MQYVPFGPKLEGVPNVLVDGAPNAATVLTLSHWPGNATPKELKADTSAEIVLNYLRSERAVEYRSGADAVSNNHFDIDGLIGLWAILHPDEALEHAELLVAIAACGDFQRWEGEHAAKAVCALNGLERKESSPLAPALSSASSNSERTQRLYEGMFEYVPVLLNDIESPEEFWRDEFELIQQGRELFASGEATLKEFPDVDLAVVRLPRPTHAIAVHEQTERSRVARVLDDDRYLVRYRYESWVEYVSREIPPVLDLEPFANLLQTFEGNSGYWRGGDANSITPVLRFVDESDENAPSSITSGLFVNLLVQFLSDNARNESLFWSSLPGESQAG